MKCKQNAEETCLDYPNKCHLCGAFGADIPVPAGAADGGLNMTPEQKQAYDWAKNQNYTSVAARYAKVLADMLDDLSTRNEGGPVAQAGWIPVVERKPEDGVKVLVSVKGRDEALIGWYDADWEDWVVEEELAEKKLMPVTHWQEKPLPAKDDGKE